MNLRLRFFWLYLPVIFLILALRLFQLTVIDGDKNRKIADNQRIRLRKITAPRGIIYDRNGIALVKNFPLYKKCQDKDFKCKTVSRDEALNLQAQGNDSDLVVDIGRKYPYGEAFAHLLGYLGEVDKEEIVSQDRQNKKCPDKNYKLGDLIGRTGIEEQYECLLKGVDGAELIEVDSDGKVLRRIGRREPITGGDLYLSIDIKSQEAAFKALGGRKGAVIAQNPGSGEVLVLVSSPSFDPNNITSEALSASDNPLFNRAISGLYPPGSVFKIVTATAALEEEKISPQTKILDTGVIVIGKYRYANWYFTQYGRTEGEINLVTAIKRSADTFFYKVGEMVGAGKIVLWTKKFNLDKVSGIDIPGEVAGFLPDPERRDWFLGNTYHLAIGQGDIGLTPLKANSLAMAIANGGKLFVPKIAKIKEEDNNSKEVGIKPETISIIKEGMKEACSTGGTAYPLFDFKPPVACKTGTAEFSDPNSTHAWLTAFSPIDHPQIVLTVLVEGGGEGSTVAAPIAKKVLEEWFKAD